MRIKQIRAQYRRDFWADYECEHCGFIDWKVSGYDDAHFHNVVVPSMRCKICGKVADASYVPWTPKDTNDIV